MSSCFASAVRSATAPPNEFPTSAAGRCSATASTNENDSVGSGVSPHPGRSGVDHLVLARERRDLPLPEPRVAERGMEHDDLHRAGP